MPKHEDRMTWEVKGFQIEKARLKDSMNDYNLSIKENTRDRRIKTEPMM